MGAVTREQRDLADAIREQNALYEEGNVDRAFWIGQQDRLLALQATEPTLTLTAIGEMVGKNRSWATRVLAWDRASTRGPDWANKPQAGRDEQAVKRVIRDRPEVIAEALEDPEVAQAVAHAASDQAAATAGHAFAVDRVHRDVARTERRARDAEARGEVTMGGSGAAGMADEMLAGTMDQAINSLHFAAVKAEGQMDLKGFFLLPSTEGDDRVEQARAKLAAIGRITAKLMDGLDAYETNAARGESEVRS